jgi:putative ABC transport system permease protein
MLELVLANLRTRPFRTLISVVGVALGVVLVVLFTGLARGMSNDMARRASNWKAEIVFTRPGAMEMTSGNASVSVTYAQKLKEIEGVKEVVPVIRYVTPSPKGRWGIQQLDGVDWEPFARMNDMQIVQGRAATGVDEVILDERQAREDKVAIGDTIQLFGGKDFRVTGIFSPPSGSRIKMSLSAMQNALQVENKCTYILVKLKDGEDPEKAAARINEKLPGNKINLTRDLVIDAEERIPALNTFLKALVGLGIFVSTIFVLLSMYTTITERRKEIGVLKSLGASKLFVVRVIEQEALMIGVLGVVLGFIVSFLAAFVIQKQFELVFEFSWGWTIGAALIAIGGSLLGALYPAWRASSIDPVLVLANE